MSVESMSPAMASNHSIKIAAISDIHSNVFALEAVLADIDDRSVQQVVNLGDILYGPIAPRQTYELLRAYQGWKSNDVITIQGNQDRLIYEADEAALKDNPTLRFIIDELPADAIKWLSSLPIDYQLQENCFNEVIYLCHGAPNEDAMYLLEEVSSGSPVIREDSDIITRLAGQDASIILCGHSHISRTVMLSNGQIVVNTGSVGYPAYTDELPVNHKMESCSPHASYALLECIKTPTGRQWQVEQVKIPYDFEAAAQLAARNGREDWAFALRTGRVMTPG